MTMKPSGFSFQQSAKDDDGTENPFAVSASITDSGGKWLAQAVVTPNAAQASAEESRALLVQQLRDLADYIDGQDVKDVAGKGLAVAADPAIAPARS